MMALQELNTREARIAAVQKRRLYLQDELRRVNEQRACLEATLPRYETHAVLPAPSGLGGNAGRTAGMTSLVKKRPVPSPLAKPPALAEPPLAAAYSLEKRPRLGELDKEKRINSIFSQCQTILKQLMKLKDAAPFLKPVDPVALKCPDYFTIVKTPMDFGTILKKLEHKPEKGIFRMYNDPADFVADMRLVFENCRTYNQVGHPVRKMGETMAEAWEKKWQTSHIQEKWDAELNAQEGQYDDGKAHLQQKVHQYTAELHNALGTLRPGASKPPGDRPMTFEERRKLSIALSRLQGDSLARVVQIVGEDPCYTNAQFDTEVEVDIDQLSATTHWKLDKYVNGVFEHAQPTKTAGTGGVSSLGASDHRVDQEDTSRPPDAARLNREHTEAPLNRPARSRQTSSSDGSGSTDDSEVGSKQINGSLTHDAGQGNEINQQRNVNKEAGAAGTFFSATAPSKSNIVKSQSRYKKNDPINENAWARLASDTAEPGGAADDDEGEARGDDAKDLWEEFQNREQQQAQRAQEQRAEEERIQAARAAKEEAARREAEAARRKEEEEEAERKRKADEEAELRLKEIEAQRAKELEAMKNATSGVNLNANQELGEHLKPTQKDNALRRIGLQIRGENGNNHPDDDDEFDDAFDANSEDGEL